MFARLFDPDKIAGQIRHWLGVIGSILVTFAGLFSLDWLTAELVNTATALIMGLVGAVFAIIAFVASWKSKE